MAGHSQFANIKHKKAAADVKRGRIFHRILKELAVAAKAGGANPDTNPGLRLAIEKAKQSNMPNDTINRALAKASGKEAQADFEEIVFEGYGPNGTAYIVKVLTDNHKRSVSNVKAYFSKAGGQMAVNGAVQFLFEEKGICVVKNTIDEETVMNAVLEANATDFFSEDGMYQVTCEPKDLLKIVAALKSVGYADMEMSEVVNEPHERVELDSEGWAKNKKLIDQLDEDDDVQEVSHNILEKE